MIVDKNGNSWSLPTIKPAEGAGDVQKVVTHGRTAYQKNADGFWYKWTGTAWRRVRSQKAIAILENVE
jgi:hypothetical protein